MANTAFEHSPTITVPGSGNSTDNAVVLWNGTTGNNFSNSTIIVGATTMGLAADTDLLTFGNGTLAITGTVTGVTALTVDNLTIDGNTIISTDSNGSITLTPNGTGSVVISKVDINSGAIDGSTIGASSASTAVVTSITSPTAVLTNSTNAYAITLNTGTTAANYTITMPTAAPGAAGKILQSSGGSPHSVLVWADAGAANQNAWTTITRSATGTGTAAGDASVAATTTTDSLDLVAGDNITITGDSSNQKYTIAAAGGGAADDYFASSGLSSKDQGDGLHIKIGDSGGTASSAGNELIIEGAGGNIGMSILGNGTGGSYIYLGDGAAPSRAGINYSHGDDQLVLRSGDNTRMIIAAGGAITKPAQPCFGRRLSSSVTNVTGNGDGYVVVWEALSSFGYDYGGNCESNNTTFTAPVDGIYWFEAALTMTHVADNHTEGYIRIKTTSSPWLELINYFQPYANETSINSFTPVNITGTMELNADQGVVVDIKVYGGSKIVDINGSTNIHSRWSGMLVA